MGKKAGALYEDLAQVVFQSIVNQSDLRNVEVRNNVRLEGKFGNLHQIDIYWKFAVDRLEYETVVEAKDWKSPVDVGELLRFRSVLDDLPGQPKGIHVSRSGYQKGALEYARAHGILLYELREADYLPNLQITTTGWAQFRAVRMPLRGIVMTTAETKPDSWYALGLDVDVFTPNFSNIRFEIPVAWVQSEYPDLDVSVIWKHQFPVKALHETFLYNEDGAVICNLAKVFRQITDSMSIEGLRQGRRTHLFEKATFLQTGAPDFPRVNIQSVSVDVEIECRHEIRRARMSNFAQWVLRELNSGSAEWFGVMPSVTALLPDKDTL
jgi:hypothetical protein